MLHRVAAAQAEQDGVVEWEPHTKGSAFRNRLGIPVFPVATFALRNIPFLVDIS